MSGWQPIETAPRDGSCFWAYLNETGIRLVRWSSAEEAAARDGGNPDEYTSTFVEVSDETEEWSPRWWLPRSAIPVPPLAQRSLLDVRNSARAG